MTGLSDLSIGQRLTIGFGLFFIIIAALLAVVFHWNAIGARAQADFSERIAPLSERVHALERGIFNVGIRLRSALLEPTDERVEIFHASATGTRNALQRLSNAEMESDGAALYARTAQATLSYLEAAEAAVARRPTGTFDLAEESALSELRRTLLSDTEALATLQDTKRAEALAQIASIRATTSRAVVITTVLAAIILAFLAWLTARSINRPARQLLQITSAVEEGDWKPALSLASSDRRRPGPVRDEMHKLANAFGAAAVAVEGREQRLLADGQVAKAVASSLDRTELSDSALQNVVRHLGAEVGVIYQSERAAKSLQPVAMYGLSAELPSVPIGEGVPGQAARDRRTVLVADIPADSDFQVKLGYDQAPPKAVAAVPLIFRDTLHGVLLVASLRPFTADATAFLESCATQLGIGLQNVAAYEQIQTLLTNLRERNEQIQAQNEELQVQNEEIQAQNEEIQAQSQQLQVQHEEMQAQNEELTQQSEELRRHAAMLADADERKNKFLGVLAHELRNPMAPIANSIFILKRSEPGSESALRAQAVIERQATHLVRLIDDLLDVTRISEGKIHIQHERLDLVDVVRTCVEDLAVAFEQSAIALELDLPNVPVAIDGDRIRLCQVLGNLLNNSMKFSDRQGHVTLSLRVDHGSGEAVLRVSDDGIGMEADLLPKLFQPFSQGISGLARTKGGLGLGLALVKALVALHDGVVEARSDGPGKGAEFIVRLPLASADAALHLERRTSHEAALVGADPPVGRILVIEDNVDAARTLSEALRIERYQVAVTYSGAEGVEEAKRFKPDVVLCDIGLPDLDGYDVARELRSDPELRSTILIALTGYASAPDRELASFAGFDLHLAKPLKLAELTRILTDLSQRDRVL